MTYQEFKTVFEKSLKERKLDYRKSSRSEYLIKFHKDDVINGDLILFEGRIANGESKIFSEGFQMLSIVTGTFNNVANVSRCPDDREPYVKKVVKESREGYNLFMYKDLYEWCLVGFTTCTSYIGRFEIFSDDIDDLAESGLNGVVNRIIYNSLTGRAKSIHLFESTIAAAHSCREY